MFYSAQKMAYNGAKQRKDGDKMSEDIKSKLGGMDGLMWASAWLMIICAIFILDSVVQLAHLKLGALLLPLAVVAALTLYGLVQKKEEMTVRVGELALIGICFLAAVIVFGCIVGGVWEYSLWGRGFYCEAIVKMADGWNPIYEGNSGVSEIVYRSSKASWSVAAALYAFLGHFEMAKSLTLLFMVPTSILGYFTFKKLCGRTKLAAIATLLLVLNPIALSQMFSFYDDAVLLYAVSCFLFLGYLIFDEGYLRGDYLLTMAALWIFILHLQYTGLKTAVVLLVALVALVGALFGKSALKWLLPHLTATLVMGFVIVGFNPFVQNLLDVGNPFSAYMGSHALLVSQGFMPAAVEGKGWLGALFYGLFASPDVAVAAGSNIIVQQFSALVDAAYAQADVRLRGFGFLGGVALLLAVALLFLGLLRGRSSKGGAIYYAEGEEKSCISLSVAVLWLALPPLVIGIMSSSVWWARCESAWWLLVPMALVFSVARLGGRQSGTSRALLLVALLNVALMALSVLPTAYSESQAIQGFWSRMATETLPSDSDAQLHNQYLVEFKDWYALKNDGEAKREKYAFWTKIEGLVK